MLILQGVIFFFGVLAFLAAALFIGQPWGDTLWRIGVASMLIDLTLMKLWPHTKTPG